VITIRELLEEGRLGPAPAMRNLGPNRHAGNGPKSGTSAVVVDPSPLSRIMGGPRPCTAEVASTRLERRSNDKDISFHGTDQPAQRRTTGRRYRAANVMIRSRYRLVIGLASTIRPPFGVLASASMVELTEVGTVRPRALAVLRLDDQLEPGWLLHWKVTQVFPTKDQST
jgi:hypothetical protein